MTIPLKFIIKFRKKNYIYLMQLFSSDDTIFSKIKKNFFFCPQNQKNCPQKLLIIPLDQQFSVQQVFALCNWDTYTQGSTRNFFSFFIYNYQMSSTLESTFITSLAAAPCQSCAFQERNWFDSRSKSKSQFKSKCKSNPNSIQLQNNKI